MKIDPNLKDAVLELSQLALIKASGPDAETFLNNQFTNDINDLEQNQWQFNGYCTAQGRLIAIMRLFKFEDDIYIIIPKSIVETLVKRLQVYVFRSKVDFEILDRNFYLYLGEGSAEKIDTKFPPQQFALSNHGFTLNLSSQTKRYLAIDEKRIDSIEDLISGELADKHWRLSEINEQIPTIFSETVEKFIPQHINLDQIGGVSFKKGCFPGQEVVARLHYLGKSKQSIQKITLGSQTKLKAGDSVSHPQTRKPLTIVDAIKIDDQSYQCLVVGQFQE